MNLTEIIEKARIGVTGKELIELNKEIGFNKKEWAYILDISPSTFSKYLRNDSMFDIRKSEKIFLINDLSAKGKEVFCSLEKFKKWLGSESKIFKNKTHMSFLNTYSGVELLEIELSKIEHGLFA